MNFASFFDKGALERTFGNRNDPVINCTNLPDGYECLSENFIRGKDGKRRMITDRYEDPEGNIWEGDFYGKSKIVITKDVDRWRVVE